MRNALRDLVYPLKGKVVRPGAVGVNRIPSDPDALEIVRYLAKEATKGAFRGVGCYPGAYVREALVRVGLGLGGPSYRPGRTLSESEALAIYERLLKGIEDSSESERLRQAIWWRIVAAQTFREYWGRPEKHYIGAKDPDFPRVCKVAAARMLSQRQVWQVVLRPDNRAGLRRNVWPESFIGV